MLYPITVYTIIAFVRAGAIGKFEAAAGYGIPYNLSQFSNPIVFLGASHIESCVMNQLTRSMERSNKRSGDILDVHNRSPGRAVAFQVNPARGKRPRNQIIENQIETKTR